MVMLNKLGRALAITWKLIINTWQSGWLGKASAIGILSAPLFSYGSLGLAIDGLLPYWIPAVFFFVGNVNSTVLAPTLVAWHNGGRGLAVVLYERLTHLRLTWHSS